MLLRRVSIIGAALTAVLLVAGIAAATVGSDDTTSSTLPSSTSDTTVVTTVTVPDDGGQTSTTVTSVPGSIDGSTTFEVESAGTVEITVGGSAPELISAIPNADWIVD